MFVPPQPMTLRRFVRVTIDNFRQLIQSYATPVATLPMADSHVSKPAASLQDGETDRESGGARAQPALQRPAHAPAPEMGEAPPAAGADSQRDNSAQDDSVLDDAGQVEGVQVDTVQIDTVQIDAVLVDTALPDGLLPVTRDETADQSVVLVETIGEVAPPPVSEEEAAAIEPPAAPAETTGETTGEETGAEAPAAEPAAAQAGGALALAAALESLLFVAEEPLEPSQAARVFGLSAAEVETALQALDALYRDQRRGLRIQVRNGRYQMVTAPEAAGLIETFLNLDTSTKLSGPALETLAVVAYRQPVTRAQIEAVRGVDCSGVLRSLLQRGLIEEVGRMEAPGRPVLYGVSDLFMRHFGLTGLHELPPLATEEDSRIDEIISVEENPPSV